MTFVAVRVGRHGLKTLDINGFLTASSDLDCSGRQVAQYVKVAFENLIDALSKGTVLLESLRGAGLDHKSDELLNVTLSNFLFLAALAELDLISVGKCRGEVEIDRCFELLV